MRTPERSWLMLAISTLAALHSAPLTAAPILPGIVDGPDMRLSGTHTFTFNSSIVGGTITWSLDRETISSTGTRTRTNGIASRTGLTASFSLTSVSGSETIYYVNAADQGVQDVATVQVFPANTKTWFTYRSAGNPDVRVYTVIPSTLSPSTRILLAMHGNSRTASSYADYWRSWASSHNYIVLCPYYDEVNWPTEGMYHMGNVFSGEDCDGVLNPQERWTFSIDLAIHQRARGGFVIADPLFDMWGFSGGGQHVHRFMLYEPNAPVRTAIAAGSGWYTAPDLVIDCPYGVDNAPLSFTHQDLMTWTNRNMIIMVGTADTVRDEDLRTTARADAQGLNRYERAGYMISKGLATNPLSRWRRIDVPNVGHSAQPMAVAAQSVLQGAPVQASPLPRPDRRGASFRIHPNPLAGNARLSGEGWNSEEVEVEVYDIAGRKLAARTAMVSAGAWRLDWSALGVRSMSGLYLVRARDRERQVEQKVLVTR
ncbi:MAG TPA: T9SS type A sorting domain-containing protein [Candidatus Eisenbacteria bacterium]|nr:T9SS type A sorting domain-containing protein [Candidatus Eisenbacteria bacterium]